MVSKYVREQKRYSQKELKEIFECSEEETTKRIRKLKEFGIIKAVRATEVQRDMEDLLEEDIELENVEVGEERYFYVFTFVGVIIVFGQVLKCYPKYLMKTVDPMTELRQVIKVLEKYDAKEQIIRLFNDSSESSTFNLLAILLFLLSDFYENGVYSNTEEIIESNGSGEIRWEKTINETFALISNNRPFYTELQTKKRIFDEFDYFKRLHECILTKASQELKDAQLLDLFEITPVDLSDEVLDDFGENEYILYRIEKELNTQFNTRKQITLKTIYAYVSQNGCLSDLDSFSLFGTNRFNLVWEGVCADIMDNQLKRNLVSLKLPKELQQGYKKNQTLKDIIEKPLWSITGTEAKDTFIPDLIAISGDQFIIIDAKYYNAKFESGRTPKGQPGIESVTKQYLYQLAYKKFISEHGFASVRNCFVMPTENQELENCGDVSMKILSLLDLESIKVWRLPAHLVYEHYLAEQKMDISPLTM